MDYVTRTAKARTAASLSLQQTPPISVPLRFFLSAPLFGLGAAVTLLAIGPDAWMTRWSPAMLAVTHLMTLGFLAMVMIGAILQMLPVVAGAPVVHVRTVSALVHALLVFGTLGIGGGFLLGRIALIRLALVLLAAAFTIFIAAAAESLRRARAAPSTVRGMRFSIVALTVTVGLGLFLGGIRAWNWAGNIQRLAALHLTWGLIGWVGLLVVGVGFQVVPMFQTTPPYPRLLTTQLVRAIFATLVLWSAAQWLSAHLSTADVSAKLFGSILALGYVIFGTSTLYLQHRRRREALDVTVRFWRIGMASLIACALLWWLRMLGPWARTTPFELTWGILAILGFGVSVINGMLYKIVPFLVWLHLQSSATGRGRLPNMKEIVADARARFQYWLHCTAVLLLIGVSWAPRWLALPAAAALGASCLVLWFNLFGAYRLYLRTITGVSVE